MAKRKHKPEPLTYEQFRTGYDYAAIYYMIFKRKWKRRNGVLGAWREIKVAMYRKYLEDFDDQHNPPF